MTVKGRERNAVRVPETFKKPFAWSCSLYDISPLQPDPQPAKQPEFTKDSQDAINDESQPLLKTVNHPTGRTALFNVKNLSWECPSTHTKCASLFFGLFVVSISAVLFLNALVVYKFLAYSSPSQHHSFSEENDSKKMSWKDDELRKLHNFHSHPSDIMQQSPWLSGSWSHLLSKTTIKSTTSYKGIKNHISPPIRKNCDDIMIGAWIETCFIMDTSDESIDGNENRSNTTYSDDSVIFPGKEGVLSYPIFVVAAENNEEDNASTSGNDEVAVVNLFGYSPHEPFFGGRDYYELGRGFKSHHVMSTTPLQHCRAKFQTYLKFVQPTSKNSQPTRKTDNNNRDINDITEEVTGGDNETNDRGDSTSWAMDVGNYYWNWIDEDHRLTGGKGSRCYFQRIQNQEWCQQMRKIVLSKMNEELNEQTLVTGASSLKNNILPPLPKIEIPEAICSTASMSL